MTPMQTKLNKMNPDPSIHEMLNALQPIFGCEQGFRSEAEVAIYWFASHYHGGQWTNLYKELCRNIYQPGSLSTLETEGWMVQRMYETLERKFANALD